MSGQEILGNLQEDIDTKKQVFLSLMREFHSNQPMDKKSIEKVEKARVEWLIAINHLKVSLPFLGSGDHVSNLLTADKETEKTVS